MKPGFAHQASASFLTRARGPVAPGFQERRSRSNQFAAKYIGGRTRFPSLALSGEGAGLSWTRTGALVPAFTSPSKGIRQLFSRRADTTRPQAQVETASRTAGVPRRRPRPGQRPALDPRLGTDREPARE